MKRFYYNVIFRPESEGGFTVVVPSLPGCISYGRNLREAQNMARDAIKGYIVSLKKHGEPIPTDEGNFITLIDLEKISPKKSLSYA